jgi:hypothetical protein
MSARIKPHKVRGRQLEEVREKDPTAGSSSTTAPSTRSPGCCARAPSTRRCTTPPATSRQASSSRSSTRCAPSRSCGCRGAAASRSWARARLHARRRVHAAMEALGGISSPAGSCVWHVVGLQRSVGSGRSARAGADAPCGRSRHRRSWLQRWGCLRLISAMRRPSGQASRKGEENGRRRPFHAAGGLHDGTEGGGCEDLGAWAATGMATRRMRQNWWCRPMAWAGHDRPFRII